MYTAVARSNDAEPNDVAARKNWAEGWSERCISSDFGKQAVSDGHTTAEEMQAISTAWVQWAAEPRGLFCKVSARRSGSLRFSSGMLTFFVVVINVRIADYVNGQAVATVRR